MIVLEPEVVTSHSDALMPVFITAPNVGVMHNVQHPSGLGVVGDEQVLKCSLNSSIVTSPGLPVEHELHGSKGTLPGNSGHAIIK